VTEFINSNGNSPYKDSSINFRFLKLKNIIISDCNNCLKFIEESIKINPKAQFKDVNEAVQDSSSLKSLCYYELGYIEYKSTDFAKALDYFQNSFNSDPNQISIFQIALATIKLPAEGGGFFGGKKTEEAKANKKIQEIDLLKKTIQFSPFSFLGIKSASLLYENYGILVNQADLKNK
jgi:tetratricopeptide (TPR) repeat protein